MNLQVDVERVCLAHRTVCSDLRAERAADGHWTGELASSPLATAAAISALVIGHRHGTATRLRHSDSADGQHGLAQIVQHDLSELLLDSVQWLARHQNPDGGWGDCDRGKSTLAATFAVQAALRLTGVPAKYVDLMARADQFACQQGGVAGLRRKFDDNRTFSAGILAGMAVADMAAWRQVPALAFEWACLPVRWRRRLPPVASPHELPAFLAIGHAKFVHDPTRNPFTRLVRRSLSSKCHNVLGRLQADDGGFMNSALQTAIVVMCCASCGEQDHPVVHRGIEFLLSAVRSNASWSIDRDFSVWTTTLAVNSLRSEPHAALARRTVADQPTAGAASDVSHFATPDVTSWSSESEVPSETVADGTTYLEQPLPPFAQSAKHDVWNVEQVLDERLLIWLLDCQQVLPSLFDDAPGGGWPRSDSAGSLSNTLDTASALLSLAYGYPHASESCRTRIDQAVGLGTRWLIGMQNRDGGWPTLYGASESSKVGQSGIESTSLALRALSAWHSQTQAEKRQQLLPMQDRSMSRAVGQAVERGLGYVRTQQRADGSFAPQWFGNEYHPRLENPVFGTAFVLAMCAEFDQLDTEMAVRAAHWLPTAQHASGGWGPPRAPLDYSGSYKDGYRAWRGNDELAKYCSVEETAVAVAALLPLVDTSPTISRAVAKGLDWLTQAVEQDAHRNGSVVGFQFAEVWYHERLYPLVFAVSALSKAVRQIVMQQPAAEPVASNVKT